MSLDIDQADPQLCRKWIAEGKLNQALAWLETQEQTAETLLLWTMCQKENQLELWERVVYQLRDMPLNAQIYRDRILALGQVIKWSRLGYDQHRYLQYLQEIIRVAETTNDSLQALHWRTILANYYLKLGEIEKALPLLQESVHQSIVLKQRLLLISQGTLLCSLWMSQGKFEEVASLCLQIDQAAIERSNWIALACSRNTRSSCWLIRKSQQQSINLLLDTGDFLAQKGACAALNLVKARLGELQLILGKPQLLSLIQKRNASLH